MLESETFHACLCTAKIRLAIAILPLGGEIPGRSDFSALSVEPRSISQRLARVMGLGSLVNRWKVPNVELAGAFDGQSRIDDPYETLSLNLSETGRSAVAAALNTYVTLLQKRTSARKGERSFSR